MLISTIILVANLIAVVWKGVPFMSFWLNAILYVIEIILYVIFWSVIWTIIKRFINKTIEE